MDGTFFQEISAGNINACFNILKKEKNISDAIKNIRKEGYFRCSKYDYRIDTLCKLYRFIIKEFDLTDEEEQYLISIFNSWHIGCSFRKYLNIEKRPTCELKEYLALCDYCFLLRQAGRQNPFADLERIAESVSTIIHASAFNSSEIPNHLIVLDRKSLKKYSYIFEIISLIKQFKELEIKIDYYDYHVTRNKTIYEVSGDIERSLRMGYVQTELARHNDYIRYKTDKDITEQEVMITDKVTELFSHFYSKLSDERGTRFVLGISNKYELKDEKIDLFNICKEFHILDKNILYDNKILGICVLDIIRLQRLFRLASSGFRYFLVREYGDSWFDNEKLKLLILQSIIPIMQKKELIRVLRMIFPLSKAKIIVDLFCWKKDNTSKKYFDLQTFPIVPLGKFLYLLPNLTSNSNLLRNIFSAEKLRFDAESKITPLEDQLEQICREKSYFYKKDVNFEFENKNGEIDFLMVVDDEIFIFECKNSLIPTDTFQQRTSFDYIKKADKQLDFFRQNCRNKNFIEYLKDKFKITGEIKGITTGIVMGNRMFCGYIINNTVVCNIFELIRFLESGTVVSDTQTFSLWKNEKMSASDLKNYLSNTSFIVQRLNCLSPFDKKWKIEGKTIITHSYMFDCENATQLLKR